jgi:hypothetical protein
MAGLAEATAAVHRGGDRQLNQVLHVIANTPARHDPTTQAYLASKEAEGKTKKGALRCLKRAPARRFHYLLSLPAPPPQPNRGTTTKPSSTPASAIRATSTPAAM